MTWKGFFEGIETIFVDGLFWPQDQLRNLEQSSWVGANMISWIFILIGFVALIYWIRELKKYDDEGTEDRSIKAHEYLD